MRFALLFFIPVVVLVVAVGGQQEETSNSDTTTASSITEDDFEISAEEPIEEIVTSSSSPFQDTPSDQNTLNETQTPQDDEIVVDDSSSPTMLQSGPFIDLLGPTLLSLEMIDEAHAQLVPQYTNEALHGKKVVGLYFSADWCGPCRQFTPELVSFYNKMNSRRGKQNQFEIVWVSRCRDVKAYGQYFTQMNWLALPPEEAMGERGQMLGKKYKVKGIPSLVLLDEVGNVITTDARNKIPKDKAGIGFPWRNPFATLYTTILPKSLRLMVRSQLNQVKQSLFTRVKGLVGLKSVAATA